MYNRVHCAQNKRIMLKSFIPAINTSIFPKKTFEIIFSEKNLSMNYMPGSKTILMEYTPPNVKESAFVKSNGNLEKEKSIYFKYQYESYTMT